MRKDPVPHLITPEALRRDIQDMPNLIEIQQNSYQWFLEDGLRELFQNFSPIEDFTGNKALSLLQYSLEEPKYSQEECRQRDMTFESPIKALVQLADRQTGEVKEQEVYLGALPLMTERGTFIINGAERVVVSQLARSPGVYFNEDIDLSGRMLYVVRVIPGEGAWTEIETEANDAIVVRVGQTKKFPITTLLRALNFTDAARPVYEVKPENLLHKELVEPLVDESTGEVVLEAGQRITSAVFTEQISPRLVDETAKLRSVKAFTPCTTDEEILDLFSTREILQPSEENEVITRDLLLDRRPTEDLLNKDGKVIAKAYHKIGREEARRLEALGLTELELLKVNRYIEATISLDPTHSEHEALLDIHRKVRQGDPATVDSARQLLGSIYYDLRRYDLARVGRYKVNKKLKQDVPQALRCVTREDLINIIRYLIRLDEADPDATIDDIDHLENKRVRSVGELLQNQLRMGFLRMEKVAKERMTAADAANISPQIVLSIKPITASVKSFFGSSQLCQFMDQHNPLAELTHKRRLSALGPGGLSRQSAKLEVRDVHHSHYGRICPIETPEGPNIGLIGSMAIFTKIDPYGFLRTPYRIVKNGVVSEKIDYVTADEEEREYIAPAKTPMEENGRIIPDEVQVRHMNGFPVVKRNKVTKMDRSPLQIFSAAANLIPFLENDDANRALMGSNMQRQAVPLIKPDRPIVATGVEEKVARDSGAMVICHREGTVTRATAEEIKVRTRSGVEDRYGLLSMLRSNQDTSITQRPLVRKGERVRAGQVLADGPCTEEGRLALGQNVLAAFMTWEGFNYEDAIILSNRIVRDDVFTSVHIRKHECEARDTKLGPEEITRDIPNVGEEALKDLDENGVIRIGAEVQADDILVGRIAPKSQGEQSAEERLIIAIFGKKAEEASDQSLRVPHGGKGVIVDVKVFSRFKYACETCKHEYNFSKKPERLLCDRCGGELVRLPGDELSAGVNQLVRVYVAEKRTIMEGDKMAGRHGNKGVVSRILPVEEMPFLPDGTPVDIILNPLGVPQRMNIGQVLETHLGLVGHALGIDFTEPIFYGAKESHVLDEFDKLYEHLRRQRLIGFIQDEMGVSLAAFAGVDEEGVPRDLMELTSDLMMDAFTGELEKLTQEQRNRIGERLGIGISYPVSPHPFTPSNGVAASVNFTPGRDMEPIFTPVTPQEIREAVDKYCEERIGLERRYSKAMDREERTGKCWLHSGQTGELFDQPVTVGHIYMLKLLHLVEDKIHARSTGPYALVTQQPLGGKAQFGGQRFGEMEVWALEAYGAAYTLQEILTIKSDDVTGRVKTYESIVKGNQIQEPGVPESFKILVAELQNLGLKVTVTDEADQEIDLRLQDDETTEDPGRFLTRRFGGHDEAPL